MNEKAEEFIKDILQLNFPSEFTPGEQEKIARELRKEIGFKDALQALANITNPEKNLPLAEELLEGFRQRVEREGTPQDAELLRKVEQLFEEIKAGKRGPIVCP